jgi:hypothetical protein
VKKTYQAEDWTIEVSRKIRECFGSAQESGIQPKLLSVPNTLQDEFVQLLTGRKYIMIRNKCRKTLTSGLIFIVSKGQKAEDIA